MRGVSRGIRIAGALGVALGSLACTTTPYRPVRTPSVSAAPVSASAPPRRIVPEELQHEPVALERFVVTPEPITVEDHFLLDLYTFLHRKDYRVSRVEFPADAGGTAVAHWLVPDGPGPHPTVMVFPILAGSHVVSEALSKALVNRGYAVAHLERKELQLETATSPDVPSRAITTAVRDARRLLDWLQEQPQVDRTRIGAAGVSMGGILGVILQGVDPRVRAGFYVMAGGGIAEILYDSTEVPVRTFRDRLIEQESLQTREQFLQAMQPLTGPIDPLNVAPNIVPGSVLIASGRLDRVIPGERTQALWKALGRPTWVHLPLGHYQLLPFFWWTVGRGADHLDAQLRAAPPAQGEPAPAADAPVQAGLHSSAAH